MLWGVRGYSSYLRKWPIIPDYRNLGNDGRISGTLDIKLVILPLSDPLAVIPSLVTPLLTVPPSVVPLLVVSLVVPRSAGGRQRVVGQEQNNNCGDKAYVRWPRGRCVLLLVDPFVMEHCCPVSRGVRRTTLGTVVAPRSFMGAQPRKSLLDTCSALCRHQWPPL